MIHSEAIRSHLIINKTAGKARILPRVRMERVDDDDLAHGFKDAKHQMTYVLYFM